jgi:hypothetical protein
LVLESIDLLALLFVYTKKSLVSILKQNILPFSIVIADFLVKNSILQEKKSSQKRFQKKLMKTQS